MTVSEEIVQDWLEENWDRLKDSITNDAGRLAAEQPRQGTVEWMFWRGVRFYSGLDPSLNDHWGRAIRSWGERLGLPTSTADMLVWERCIEKGMKRMTRELGLNPEGARRYWWKRVCPLVSAAPESA